MLRVFMNRIVGRLKQRSSLETIASVGTRTEVKGRVIRRGPRGTIVIGTDCLIEGSLVTELDGSRLSIGNNVFIGGGSLVDCVGSITIADDVLMSHECILADSDNHSIHYDLRKNDLQAWKAGTRDWEATVTRPIVIERGAWIGMRSIVLKGVVVGEGSVVGAGSVVTRDVPPHTVVAGNPARVIKTL